MTTKKASAAWMRDPQVRDLGEHLAEVARHLALPQAARRAGLTETKLNDLLRRARITNPDNPQSALSRPAARIGSEPLYSPEQIRSYRKLVQNRRARRGTPPGWAVIGPEEAAARGLRTTEELRADFGVHPSSVSRWASTHSDFPAVVGVLPRNGRPGNPAKLRDGQAVRQWLHDHGLLPENSSTRPDPSP